MATSSTTNSTTSSPPPAVKVPPSEQTIVDKLFTDHDILNVHKILGFSVLISCLYRLSQVGQADMNFGPNYGSLATILLHLTLNLSSFIFHIPQRRIKDGDRIWPEYRIHSLVFAGRSLTCMFLLWCEQMMGVQEPYYLLNLVIVLVAGAAADYGSAIQGPYRSRTVRDVKVPEQFPPVPMKYFMSAFQNIGTAHCLLGTRRYSFHFMIVLVVQVTAFTFTLRRKNVLSNLGVGLIYAFLLITEFAVFVFDDLLWGFQEIFVTFTLGHIAIILRFGPLHMSKYLIWASLGLGLAYIRSKDIVEIANNKFWFVGGSTTAVASHIGTLYWIMKQEEKKNKEELEGEKNTGKKDE